MLLAVNQIYVANFLEKKSRFEILPYFLRFFNPQDTLPDETKCVNQETTILLYLFQAWYVGFVFSGSGAEPSMNCILFLALRVVAKDLLHEW